MTDTEIRIVLGVILAIIVVDNLMLFLIVRGVIPIPR